MFFSVALDLIHTPLILLLLYLHETLKLHRVECIDWSVEEDSERSEQVGRRSKGLSIHVCSSLFLKNQEWDLYENVHEVKKTILDRN